MSKQEDTAFVLPVRIVKELAEIATIVGLDLKTCTYLDVRTSVASLASALEAEKEKSKGLDEATMRFLADTCGCAECDKFRAALAAYREEAGT